MSSLDLESIEVQNLRGYSHAKLPLNRRRIVLVGPNNSGKSSVLLLLHYIVNSLQVEGSGESVLLSAEEKEFLKPARPTRNQARRIAIYLKLVDRRRWRKYRCDQEGITRLRFDYRESPKPNITVKLGPPHRKEGFKHQAEALELLSLLKISLILKYIPAFRNAESARFSDTFHEAIALRLTERALHSKQAGAPREYRRVAQAFRNLKSITEDLAAPLWVNAKAFLPTDMTRDGKMVLSAEVQDLVEWLGSRLTLKIATGEHDSLGVSSLLLASGLQSLLDLAIQLGETEEGDERLQLVIIEEPEAFLHPSAQREIAQGLLRDRGDLSRVLISTHSPTIVNEAAFGDVIIASGQTFYVPRGVDARRAEINTALLTGRAAELLFSRTVLLVEGEGDRLFYDILRQRLASVFREGSIQKAFALEVGGNNRFAPWIRLAQSYRSGNSTPIDWVALYDGDSIDRLKECCGELQIPVPSNVADSLDRASTAFREGRKEDWAIACREVNTTAGGWSHKYVLSVGDLEYSALQNVSRNTIEQICERAGVTGITTPEALMHKLGSKMSAHPLGDDAIKHPWLRGYVAAVLPWQEVSSDVRHILRTWLAFVMDGPQLDRIMRQDIPSLERYAT